MSRIVFALSLIALVSCTPKNNNDMNGSVGSAIMGGTLVKENSTLASGIVGIFDTQDNAICTGSIIGENIVLTAAHCVTTKPSKLKVIFGNDIDAAMATREPDVLQEYVRRVVDVKVHEDYNPAEHETKETDYADIALIKFQGALPQGYKPVSILPDDSVLRRGVLVTLAGYGVSDIYTEPVDPKKVKNLDEALEYGEVMCDENLRNCLKVEMSGDGVLRETKAPVSSLQETEVRLDESKGHGTCSGDSGGPAYIEKNGQYYLFGITSRGSQLCDSVGVYTNAVYYRTWIAETILKMK
ncbi:trypsin-like serine protease [Bdellovibrio sp. 22V]|uniref:S1 family peptidase n=1 Tax=Bdellovibrio TaxID=958 RepID=UPI002543AE3D|nr:trypsin-like serine protease [Bdellovibrio sp. 22V]WII73291.1 trypsin-like serine protease [Bdellovibrio sp. 22V]